MIELITEEIDLKNNTNNNTNNNTKTNATFDNQIQQTNQIQEKNLVDKLYDQYYIFKKNFINLVKRNRRTLKVIFILLIVLTILETYQHYNLNEVQIGGAPPSGKVDFRASPLPGNVNEREALKQMKVAPSQPPSTEKATPAEIAAQRAAIAKQGVKDAKSTLKDVKKEFKITENKKAVKDAKADLKAAKKERGKASLAQKRQTKKDKKAKKAGMIKKAGMDLDMMMMYGMGDKTMIMNLLFTKYIMMPAGKLIMGMLNILLLMILIVVVPAFPLLVIMIITFHFAGKFVYKLKSRM